MGGKGKKQAGALRKSWGPRGDVPRHWASPCHGISLRESLRCPQAGPIFGLIPQTGGPNLREVKSPAKVTLRLWAEWGLNPGLSLHLPTWVVTAMWACCQRHQAKRVKGPPLGVLPFPPRTPQFPELRSPRGQQTPPPAMGHHSSPGVNPPGETRIQARVSGHPTGRPGPLMTGWLLAPPTPLGRGHPGEGPLNHAASLQLKETRTLIPPSPVPQAHIQAGTQGLGMGREEGPSPRPEGEPQPGPEIPERDCWAGRQTLGAVQFMSRQDVAANAQFWRGVGMPAWWGTRSPVSGEEWPLGPAVPGLCTCRFLTSEVGTVHGSVYR